ncbi:hypothetical protein [Sphingomonas sp. CARO-RG-8B-R24-01]|uniref:hypothetical protein n=1 Tax=Sphingomonas sp. CARO-RG-8B-R24-01 TaxID=2914831 RepID=UPI001F59F51F|nr:hypothetical protein [Sphingomonas sp. CARO-RG-8B-R24-01]
MADETNTAAVKPAVSRTPATPGSTTITAKTDDAVTASKGTYTVAPGRTVDGKAPGKTVELDDGDAKRMLELGFILDTDGSIVVRADGPAVNVEDGVQVKTSA